MRMRTHITSLLVSCCCLLASAQSFATKTDIVYLNNGDRITGEVKGVRSGQLEIKTDDLGVLLINWRAIRDLVSDKEHLVQLSDGSIVSGELKKPLPSEASEIEEQDSDSIIAVKQIPVSWISNPTI